MSVFFYKLCVFFSEYLPLFAWGAISLVILILLLRDRRNRKIQLVPSREEQAISDLRRQGVLSAADAALLAQNCDALPETREISPVPDLGLRIAVALCKIYGALVLVHSFCFLLATASFWFFARLAAGGKFTMNSHSGLWALGIYLLALALAAVIFWRSGRILQGDLLARNQTLIALGFSGLLLLREAGGIYWAPFAGITVFYLLYLRPGANAKIRCDAPESSRRRKIAWSVVAVLLFAGSFGLVKYETTFSHQLIRSINSASHSSSGRSFFRLEKLCLVVGSADERTARVARMIAEKLPLPCEIIPFGQTIAVPDEWNSMVLVLTRGTMPDVSAAKQFNDTSLPVEVRRQLSGLIPVDTVGAAFAGAPGYRLSTLEQGSFSSGWLDGLSLPERQFAFAATVAVNDDSQNAGCAKVADEFAAKLEPLLRSFTGRDTWVAPALPERAAMLPAEHPMLRAPGLRNFRRIAVVRRLSGADRELYMFAKNTREADEKALGAALAAEGLRQDGRYGDGRVIFRGDGPDCGEASLLWTPSGESSIWGQPSPDFPEAMLFISRPRNRNAGKGLRALLQKRDPRWFVLSRGLNSIKDKKQRAAMLQAFLETPELPFTMRLHVLGNESVTAENRAMVEREYRKLVAELGAMRDTDPFLSHFQELYRIGKSGGMERLLTEPFADVFTVVTAGDKAERMAEGYSRQLLHFPYVEGKPFQRLVLVRFPDGEYRDLLLSFMLLPDPERPGCFIKYSGCSKTAGLPAADVGKSADLVWFRAWQSGAKPRTLDPGSWSSEPVTGQSYARRVENHGLRTRSFFDSENQRFTVELMRPTVSPAVRKFQEALAGWDRLDDAAKRSAAALLKQMTGDFAENAQMLYRRDPAYFPAELLWQISVPADGKPFAAERAISPKNGVRLLLKLTCHPVAGGTILPLVLVPNAGTNTFYCRRGSVVDESAIARSLVQEWIRFAFRAGRGGTWLESSMSRRNEPVVPRFRPDEIAEIIVHLDPERGTVKLNGICKESR